MAKDHPLTRMSIYQRQAALLALGQAKAEVERIFWAAYEEGEKAACKAAMDGMEAARPTSAPASNGREGQV
jgi:hypothetical protein